MVSPRCSPPLRSIRLFMRYGEQLPAAHDLTSLRVIACTGEPLNPEAWHWAQTYLAGDGKWGYVVDNWWQTELGRPTLGTPATMPYRTGKAGIPAGRSQPPMWSIPKATLSALMSVAAWFSRRHSLT